jgi:hypothetical protein
VLALYMPLPQNPRILDRGHAAHTQKDVQPDQVQKEQAECGLDQGE